MIVMPRRLSDEVASRVRALIEEQQLEAGMKLPAERQLAVQLGVSRNSLREALAKLVSEGVLISRRGGGTFVRWQHDDWSEQNIVQPLKTSAALATTERTRWRRPPSFSGSSAARAWATSPGSRH